MIFQFSQVISVVIYISLFILVSFFINKFRKYKVICFFCLIPIILLFGYRYCGTDIITYEQIITRFGLMDISNILTNYGIFDEAGFAIVCNLFYNIGGFPLVNIVFAILILLPVYTVFLNQEKEYDLFLMSFIFLIAFFTVAFNIMRQFIAVSLIFYATYKLRNGNKIQYFIIVFFAFLFHVTGIFGLLFYIIETIGSINNYKTKRNVLKLFVLLLLAIFIGIATIAFFSRHIYSGYLENVNSGGNRDFYVIILKCLILFALKKILKKKSRASNKYLFYILIGLVIGITGFYSYYIKRLYYYFIIYECFSFSLLPSAFKQKKFVTSLVVMFYIFLFILTTIIIPQGHIVPLRIKL